MHLRYWSYHDKDLYSQRPRIDFQRQAIALHVKNDCATIDRLGLRTQNNSAARRRGGKSNILRAVFVLTTTPCRHQGELAKCTSHHLQTPFFYYDTTAGIGNSITHHGVLLVDISQLITSHPRPSHQSEPSSSTTETQQFRFPP